MPGRAVVHLPLGFVGLPGDLPERGAARGALGVPWGATLVAVVVSPGVAGRALASVRAVEAGLLARAWPDDEAAARPLLAAADMAIALEGPSGNGPSGPVLQAVAAGLPTIVSAGSVTAAELPDGVVVTVSPGPSEAAELEALLLRLVQDVRLRGRVSALARAHAEARRDPAPAASQLLALVRDLLATERRARVAFGARAEIETTLLGWALGELRWAAAGLGLDDLPPGIEPLLSPLLPGRR
jgi:glycosyltransferase involved in cell wall biosynthesis